MSRRIPKLCRHRGTGQGYVTDPLTHREVYLGAYGSAACRHAYEQWVVAFLRRAQEAERPGAAGLSVAGLWERYLDHAERYYRKHGELTSELRNLSRAAAYCLRLFAELPAEDLTPVRLKEVRSAMIQDNLCRATVNHYVRRIRRCWRWGVAEALASAAVLAGLEAVPDLPRGRGAARETDDVQPVACHLVGASRRRWPRDPLHDAPQVVGRAVLDRQRARREHRVPPGVCGPTDRIGGPHRVPGPGLDRIRGPLDQEPALEGDRG